jgi:hypothetical protein
MAAKSMLTPEHQAALDHIVEQSKRWGCYTLGQLMDKLNEQHDEIARQRAALEAVAGFGDVNLQGEWEAGLRDIIRSMTDCARNALGQGGNRKWSRSSNAE